MGFQVKDYYFKKAKAENYRARSVYKLQEIDEKFKVLRRGDRVVDLGYYPGSWVQYCARTIGKDGQVVGIDIQGPATDLNALSNVQLYKRDVFDVAGPEDLGVSDVFDVLLSDMAPKTTGMKSVDQARSLGLVEQVFHIMPRLLRPGGNLVIKVFDGPGAMEFLKDQRGQFKTLKFFKPKSTRSVSKEFFVIGHGYIGQSE